MSAHGLLTVDKPAGPTSHDVVRRARKALGTRAVGHAGTLDPAASGVLVLAVGEGTKLLRYLTLDDKRYDVTIRLGAETDTLDGQGTVTARAEVPKLDGAGVERVLQTFVGAYEQVPPDFSAIKQGGVSAHVRARRGEALTLAARPVVVHELRLCALRPDALELKVHCAKGFYVRSLARDLGRALGTLGHVTTLRRTQSGPHRVEGAADYERVLAAARGDANARAALEAMLIPIEHALTDQPTLVLDELGVQHARAGRLVPVAHLTGATASPAPGTEPVLLCDEAGRAVALARVDEDGLRVVRGFVARAPEVSEGA